MRFSEAYLKKISQVGSAYIKDRISDNLPNWLHVTIEDGSTISNQYNRYYKVNLVSLPNSYVPVSKYFMVSPNNAEEDINKILEEISQLKANSNGQL